MPETDPVKTTFEIDDRQVKAKFDEFDRRIAQSEKKGKSAGKGGSMFMAAAVGGAAGFVAGAVANNPAVSSVTDLLINIIAATLLPVIVALLPAIEALSKVLVPIAEKLGVAIGAISNAVGPDLLANTAIGAYIGGRIAGVPGAVVGGGLAASGTVVGNWMEEMNRPLSGQEMREAEKRAGGGFVAPDGTVLIGPGGTERTVNHGETVMVPFGPVMVPMNRDRLWGPDVIG